VSEEPDAPVDAGDGAGNDEPTDGGEGVFGEAVPATPIEPGSPSVENVAFVLLGVASTVALVFHLLSLVN
jgi:hypothetical protein